MPGGGGGAIPGGGGGGLLLSCSLILTISILWVSLANEYPSITIVKWWLKDLTRAWCIIFTIKTNP
jgi:hypothetical protein